MLDTEALLSLTETTARKAGEILAQRANLTVNSCENHDIKMQADVNSEKYVRAALSSKTPFPIVGEELGGDERLMESDQPYWVVDPLDGTFNYLRELPLTCVSIALMKGMEPITGAVFDFNRNELFSARADGTLLLNGAPLCPHWADSIDQASLVTGFPTVRDYSETALRDFIAKVQRFKKVRMLGSAALHLCYVACGRMDVYIEEDIRLWDIAAGLALVRAAGAHYRVSPGTKGKPFALKIEAAGKKEWLGQP